MKITEINGNLLDAQTDVIAHQTNCSGGFGTGVAGAVRAKYPFVYTEYRDWVSGKRPEDLLGTIQIVTISEVQCIANLFGQKSFGYDGAMYTSYDAIDNALKLLKTTMIQQNWKSVAFPYLMASHRGGAKWPVIRAMIETTFEDTDFDIEIWKLQ